jgi:heptosyltransferase-1
MTSLVVEARPWPGERPPRSILAIRLQCFGDLVAVLPFLYQVREAHPTARLDLLTRDLYAPFVDTLPWIDNAVYLGRSWTDRQALLSLVPLLPRLLRPRYEVVLDLQATPLTRRLRRAIRPAAWSQFDRHSPRPGFERARDTVERAGIGTIVHRPGIGPFDPSAGRVRLVAAGWRPDEDLILLNPGSHIPTRQWSTDHWIELAELFVRTWPRPHRLLLLGVDRMRPRAALIAAASGPAVIDLVGRTALSELGPLLSLVKLTVTEDGGLSHLSSAMGVPTLALLPGGSADVWVRHVGAHVAHIAPSGLACAPCLDTVCRFGDMRCAQWTADEVFTAATALFDRVVRESAPAGR